MRQAGVIDTHVHSSILGPDGVKQGADLLLLRQVTLDGDQLALLCPQTFGQLLKVTGLSSRTYSYNMPRIVMPGYQVYKNF